MLILFVKKQHKGVKRLFVFLQVTNVKLIKEGSGVSMIKLCVESGMLVVVLDKRVRGLNHEENVLLRTNVEARIIKVREAKSLPRWNVLARLQKRG